MKASRILFAAGLVTFYVSLLNCTSLRGVTEGDTARERFYAARVAYVEALAASIAYSARPDADPRVVSTLREVDRQVQVAEEMAAAALDRCDAAGDLVCGDAQQSLAIVINAAGQVLTLTGAR